MRNIFNTREAAEYLRLSTATLERMRVSGVGPIFAKMGWAVRYRKVDLDAWLESRLIASTSAAG